MPDNELLNIFRREVSCEFKGRHYLVRDNGAILRVPKPGVPPTKWDNIWTFGVKDKTSGYMFIAGNIRVHQVVCTAFHGPQPQPKMVVDHIDTNRCNNRPENLRWLTRLENALNNDATRKKIIYLCGSIEAFLENPAIIRTKALLPDVDWMRTVTKEQAEACKKHIDEWVARDYQSHSSSQNKGSIGEWIYSNSRNDEIDIANKLLDQIASLDPLDPERSIKWYHAAQILSPMWPCAVVNSFEEMLFLQAPYYRIEPEYELKQYAENLEEGKVFMANQDYITSVEKVVFHNEVGAITVLVNRPVGQRISYYVFSIWEYNGMLYHKKLGSFGSEHYRYAIEVLNRTPSIPTHMPYLCSCWYTKLKKDSISILRSNLTYGVPIEREDEQE